MSQPKRLDTVAILEDLLGERLALVEPEVEAIAYLPSGLVGAIAHIFHQDGKEHYLIEFSDAQGCEYATARVHPSFANAPSSPSPFSHRRRRVVSYRRRKKLR